MPLAPLPSDPPPFGTWVLVIGDQGASSHAVLRRDGARGFTLVTLSALRLVDASALDSLLDVADEQAAARMAGVDLPPWPSELPRLDSLLVSYTVEEIAPGTVVAHAGGSSRTHGFSGSAIRLEGLRDGVIRQRWLD